MDGGLQSRKSPEQLAHEEIQAYKRKIEKLKESKCITYIIPEDGNFDDTLFGWDELSDEENVGKIKDCYEKCISLAEKFNIDFDIIFEFADLLRYNKEYEAAFDLLKKLEKHCQLNGASPWDHYSLYVRMRICCEKIDGKANALPYCRESLKFSLKLKKEDTDKVLDIVSSNLFLLADFDWWGKCLEEDLELFQQTLDWIKQASKGDETTYNELIAVAMGYIAICKALHDGMVNDLTFWQALGLFQHIFGERPCFKWPLEVAACCNRLATTLKNIMKQKWPYVFVIWNTRL